MSPRSFSFVATSRNDDHGGDVLRRTQSFVRYLALQAERHQLKSELVLVDWNPPQSRAPLADVLDWPQGSEFFSAKVVTVPHERHLQLPNARTLAMFQMIAKNVGLRRATGSFKIATNIDIIFSDEIFQWLKTAELDERTLYRSDRWDIPNDIQQEKDFDQLLRRAQKETIRKNLKEGTYDFIENRWVTPDLKRVDHRLVHPIKMALQEMEFLLERGHDIRPHLKRALEVTLPEMRRFYLTPSLHENGCGDFTMLSARGWEESRAYPEWPVFSWNIDSVFLKQLAYSGYPEVISPPSAVHYHIEHSYASGYTPQGADALFRRMDQRAVTLINWEDFRRLALEMDDTARSGKEVLFNDTDWGMAGEPLPEQICASERTPLRPARAENTRKLSEGFDSWGMESSRILVSKTEWPASTQAEVDWKRGAPLARFTTGPEPWIYSGIWTLADQAPANQQYWLRFTCEILQGAISIVILSDKGDSFLVEMNSLDAGDGPREIVIHVPPQDRATSLVVRTRDKGTCIVEISDIEIFWETAEANSNKLAKAHV